MKCLTCNECSDKEICAKANGFDKAPYPLVSYFKKLCEEPETLNCIKEHLKLQTVDKVMDKAINDFMTARKEIKKNKESKNE